MLKYKKSLDERKARSKAIKGRAAVYDSGKTQPQLPGGCKNTVGELLSYIALFLRSFLGICFWTLLEIAPGLIRCFT